MNLTIDVPHYAEPLLTGDLPRHVSLRGGRSSAKTWTVARLLVWLSLQEPCRDRFIVAARQFQKNLAESAKPAIERAIKDIGAEPLFDMQTERTVCRRTNAEFRYIGLERNKKNIKGLEGAKYFWNEEAETTTDEIMELVLPTIREPGSTLFWTWNPKHRTNAVWQRFVENPAPDDFSIHVTWQDVPPEWRPDVMEEERLRCLAENPERYGHIWGGLPDDGDDSERVLSWASIEAGRKQSHDLPPGADEGPWMAGYDPAMGGDANSLVIRRGSVVHRRERWHSDDRRANIRRVIGVCQEYGTHTLAFDSGGLGAGMEQDLATAADRVVAFKFGEAVAGPDVIYSNRVRNRDQFAKRNAQAAQALKIRADNTLRHSRGERGLDTSRMLFYATPMEWLELAQPVMTESVGGKMTIQKKADGEPSPDDFDALLMSFQADSERGLTAGPLAPLFFEV